MVPKQKASLFGGMARFQKGRDRVWQGTTSDTPLIAIDALNFHSSEQTKGLRGDTDLQKQTLTDETVVEWLQDEHQILTTQTTENASPQSRIRLLVCHETSDTQDNMKSQDDKVSQEPNLVDGNADTEKRKEKRRLWRRVKYYMSQDSYGQTEKCFRLPAQALPNLASEWGMQSSEFVFHGKYGRKVSIDITMKTADVEQLSRCGIALSYDFETKTTRAYVRGVNAVKMDSIVKVGDDEAPYLNSHTLESRVESSLSRTMQLWGHPLLLPVILLQHELASIRNFSQRYLQVDANNIAKVLSIDSYGDMKDLLGGANRDERSNEKRKKFIDGLNVLMRNAISIRRGIQTVRASASFLLGLIPEMAEMVPEPKQQEERLSQKRMNQRIKDLIKSLDNSAKGYESGIEAIISSLEVQLNLLSIVSSQLDYVKSAEMAAQAGLDSVAMMTLAVVTAVFLPATFVATLFSMSMFNWQGDGDSDRVVSSKFWIFWAIAVPLTVCVLFAWWVWWNVSRVFYNQKFTAASEVAGTRMKAFKALLERSKREEVELSHKAETTAQESV